MGKEASKKPWFPPSSLEGPRGIRLTSRRGSWRRKELRGSGAAHNLSGYEAAVPITEKSNPLTRNLDKADAEKIVQLLRQCDAEIFQEEGQIMPTYQRLYSESVLTTMLQVAGKVQEVLKEPDGGLVVLSGGGTSGRMAFLMSVSFNQLMKGLGQKPLYTYLIAGGDRSVVASREQTEDSALHGIEELKKVAAGKKRVVVIGISVGLSVPFVAGQMDY